MKIELEISDESLETLYDTLISFINEEFPCTCSDCNGGHKLVILSKELLAQIDRYFLRLH